MGGDPQTWKDKEQIMNWKFWRNKSKSKDQQSLEVLTKEMSILRGKVSIIEEYLENFNDKLQMMAEHLNSNEDLIQKSLRLQYKSNQDISRKVEQSNDKLHDALDYGKKYIETKQEIDNLSKERIYLLERYIQWLDDIDLICDKLNTEGQGDWILLLNGWQKQILNALEAIGIYEIYILGESFNHMVAESINTKKKEKNKEYKPYEVIDVLQRGFIFKDGELLRKAKVITIEEGDEN